MLRILHGFQGFVADLGQYSIAATDLNSMVLDSIICCDFWHITTRQLD